MNRKTKKAWISVVLVFAMIIGVFFVPGITAQASDIKTFKITGTYQQSEARTMLDMINNFRTGPDAWQWDSSDTVKEQITGLSGLQYDYNLEQAAMQRAMELVFAYSHTRPNGESCFTAYTGSYRAKGENIAIGTSNMTAQYVFELWQETNENYSGQGHRRNMLSGNFGAVGIAHVYYNGCHYWVQEFGDSVVSSAPTSANDSQTEVEVLVSSDRITSSVYKASPASYKLKAGESAALPELTLEIRTGDTWSYAPAAAAAVTDAYTWTVKDAQYASIDGTKVTALKAGTTSIAATVGDATVEVPFTVTDTSTGGNTDAGTGGNTDKNTDTGEKTKVNLGKAVISLSQTEYDYDGTAKKPEAKVVLDGKELKSGTDYTVAYANNINPGTGTVTVTGMGEYTGTASASFTITEKEDTVPSGDNGSDTTKETIIEDKNNGISAVVTVKTDGNGQVASARADVTSTVSDGRKAALSYSFISQITKAAGTDSVAVAMTVKDGNGSTMYKVKVDTADIKRGGSLYIYKLNTKTGEYTMVSDKACTVSEAGDVSVSVSGKGTYELVGPSAANKIDKAIKAAIKPKKASAKVKTGQKISFKLSSKANPDNIKSITYTTSSKKTASVSKNGRISAKKRGTAIIKAKVMLKNGGTKTVKMKIRVK